MSLGQPKTTRENPDNYNHDYSHSITSTRRATLSQNHSFNRNRSEWDSGTPSQKGNEWIKNTGAGFMCGQTKGNETNAIINQSQKDYFQKIQECYNYKSRPSMPDLAALNTIEDTVEGMAKKIKQRLMPLR